MANKDDRFRKHDVHWGDMYIWYGPGESAEEIEHVTTAEQLSPRLWEVTEWTFVGGYEMYEPGKREWIAQKTIIEGEKDPRRAAWLGVEQIQQRGGDEWEGTAEDLIELSILPPDGKTWKQWQREMRSQEKALLVRR